MQGSQADLVDGLKEGGRGTSGSVRQQRFRKILVGAQVALSVTLLAGAALLITSFIRLTHQKLGFQPTRIFGLVRLHCRWRSILIRRTRQRFVEQTLAALRERSRHRERHCQRRYSVDRWVIARFTRAPIAMCRQSKNARPRRVTTFRPDISRLGGFLFSPAAISMNTMLPRSEMSA